MARPLTLIATLATVAAGVLILSSPAVGSADPQHQVFRVEAPFEFENPCNGERFTGTVSFLIVDHAVAAERVIPSLFYNSAQLLGESASGAQYVGTLVSIEKNLVPTTSPPDEHISIGLNPTFSIIRQGEDGTQDDFLSHVLLIAKIENDTIVFNIEHVRSECR